MSKWLYRLAIAAAVAFIASLLVTRHAKADSIQTHCSFARHYGVTCTTTRIADPAPMTAEERAEIEERDRKWESFCKPTSSAPNADGIVHKLYTQPGCEFGRDH